MALWLASRSRILHATASFLQRQSRWACQSAGQEPTPVGKLRTCPGNERNNYPFNERMFFLEASLPCSCLQSFCPGTFWSCLLFSLNLQKHIFFSFSFFLSPFPSDTRHNWGVFSQGLRDSPFYIWKSTSHPPTTSTSWVLAASITKHDHTFVHCHKRHDFHFSLS